jgi:hypothetical protein
MLVTDTSWAESHPVKRALAKPYQARRCVGWTDETLKFLIVASRVMRAGDHLPDGWLVGGPEALLDATSQLEPGAFTVYVLDRATDVGEIQLGQVTGIWREQLPEGAVPSFWYATGGGEPKPCSRMWMRSDTRPELVSVLSLAKRTRARRTRQ